MVSKHMRNKDLLLAPGRMNIYWSVHSLLNVLLSASTFPTFEQAMCARSLQVNNRFDWLIWVTLWSIGVLTGLAAPVFCSRAWKKKQRSWVLVHILHVYRFVVLTPQSAFVYKSTSTRAFKYCLPCENIFYKFIKQLQATPQWYFHIMSMTFNWSR